jgi:arginase
VTAILVPFHQDDRLPAETIPLPDGLAVRLVDPMLPEQGKWERLVALYDAMADAVAADVAAGGRPTVASGDCLAILGTLTGLQRAGVHAAIVWFDAHGDVHSLSSSTSGYLGGMALRMAIGGDPDKLSGPLGMQPLPEGRAVLVDARDLDPGEVSYLAGSAVRRSDVEHVDPDLVPEGSFILHVDLDVIDASEVPGLRFPVGGGPSARAVLAAIRRLVDSDRVAAYSLACSWYPGAGPPEVDIRAALLAELLEFSANQ